MPTPQPPVIWARCAEPAHLAQVATLEQMLSAEGDAVRFVCTLRDPKGTDALLCPEGSRDVRTFLFAHRPIAMLWIGGVLDKTTLAPCYVINLPVIVLEGSDRMLSQIMGSWMPHRTRTALGPLHAVFADDKRTKAAFVEGGTQENRIEIVGSLGDVSTVLTYREEDRAELAEVLGTRPVWLAASAEPRDMGMLCDAHRHAARRAHRLLLFVAPRSVSDAAEIAAQCRAAGLNTALRSEGAEPQEATQVYITDDDDGMGLWYRIAPITFLCGTFGSGAVDDPFHAAALGSALIHGPAYGAFPVRFGRLNDADATDQLRHPDDLGDAVIRLLAVDKAAAQANAGWDVTSRGAAAATLISAKIQGLLDGESP